MHVWVRTMRMLTYPYVEAMFCVILPPMDVVEGYYICAVPVCECKSFNLDYLPLKRSWWLAETSN
jgi:hypothetical protein